MSAVFIIAHAALSGAFLTRELSCQRGINGTWVSSSLTNSHPLTRRTFHILIAGSGAETSLSAAPHAPLAPGAIEHPYTAVSPQPCIRVTLQGESTQQEASPTPGWPAVPRTCRNGYNHINMSNSKPNMFLISIPPLPVPKRTRATPSPQPPSMRGHLC